MLMSDDHRNLDHSTVEAWVTRTNQVKYLNSKEKYLRKRIREERENLHEYIEEYRQNELMPGIKEEVENSVDMDSMKEGHVIQEEYEIKGMTNNFAFAVETYNLERKRILELSMKFLRDSFEIEKTKEQFSVQQLLDELDKYPDGDIAYLDKLRTFNPDFLLWLKSNTEWISTLQGKRTSLAHYSAQPVLNVDIKFPVATFENGELDYHGPDEVQDLEITKGSLTLEEILEEDEEKFDHLFRQIQRTYNWQAMVMHYRSFSTMSLLVRILGPFMECSDCGQGIYNSPQENAQALKEGRLVCPSCGSTEIIKTELGKRLTVAEK